MTTASPLIVSEIFGPTHQGEGPSAGRLCMFLRLMGCNQACTWCDTPYTWDASRFDLSAEGRKMSIVEVMAELNRLSPPSFVPNMLVISGGEPMLQASRLAAFLEQQGRSWHIELETAGTIAIPKNDYETFYHNITQFNVSPKLATSGNKLELRCRPSVLQQFNETNKAVFKFVICNSSDLDEIDRLTKACGIARERIWVMPEGNSFDRSERGFSWLAPLAVERGYNLTARLHVLAYGSKRGF